MSGPCHLRGLFVTAAATALYIVQDPMKTYMRDSWCMTRTQQVFTIIITVLFQGSLINKGYCGVFMSSHMLGLVKAKQSCFSQHLILTSALLFYAIEYLSFSVLSHSSKRCSEREIKERVCIVFPWYPVVDTGMLWPTIICINIPIFLLCSPEVSILAGDGRRDLGTMEPTTLSFKTWIPQPREGS